MKKLLLIFSLIISSLVSHAQVYGNTWINHSQQYVKFPISKEGIYRIDSVTLSLQYNLSQVDPRNFQLFIKGKEQFLFINGEGDGKINTQDYIEFYAKPDMRDIDSLIYWNINYVPNPYGSLFNDTLYGFLTLNNSLTNKRYQLETDTNSVLYETADHFYTDKIFSSKAAYNFVQEYASDICDPRYTQAEGYGEAFYNNGGSVSTTFGTLNTFTSSALPASVTFNFSGASVNNSVLLDREIQMLYKDNTNSHVLLKDTLFRGFVPVKQTFTLSTANLDNTTNFTIVSVPSASFSSFYNTNMLHCIEYFYPQTLDLNNKSFYRLFIDNSNTSTKNFFNFSNFNLAGSSNVLFYDLTNNKKITTTIAGTMVRAVVPDASGRKLCVMAAETQTLNVSLRKVNNLTGSFTDFKAMGGAKPYLIIYNKATKAGALAYQAYRQGMAGGSYNVIAADIDELYEQFAFGVNRHPLAITHFARFLYDSLPAKPNYVFIVGKGVSCEYLNPTYSLNLVPSMGIPTCDNMLTANLTPTSTSRFVPEVPIGRIAAYNDNDVMIYLAKVQQHESSAPAEWKKRVLHFVGGDDPGLTNQLLGYMDSYKSIIKDTLFGANVLTFTKNTTAPIQVNISDSIKNTISNGAALITFFGHGSEQGFDQAIDDPNEYNNTGKYPFVLANACLSGNIHVVGRKTVSENFVFANQKGSIGFIATTSLGFVHALHSYSTRFYQALGYSRYNRGIGDIVKETVFQNSLSFDSLIRFTATDMTLHGDPAILISNGPLPDYQINNSSVVFDTKKYTDSIGITVNITNLGKAVRDSFIVRVERYFPNGDSTIFLKTVRAPMFKDSLKFYTLIDFNRGIGLNKFTVHVDEFNQIGESIETNNRTTGTVDVFIQGGDILPVYPYKYAVVPKTTTITLKASTTDPFAPVGSYRFQLDTCDKFSTPIQSTLVTSRGGVLEWIVNLPFADSTVYFWRVSRDSTSPASPFNWKESSFQTVNNKYGWGQAHFHQFKNDAYQFVQYKKNLRKFVFENTNNAISCRTFFQDAANISTNINWFFNNITMATWGCGPNGWNFALFDSITGQPDEVVSTNYPSAGYGPLGNYVCVDNQVLRMYSFGAYDYNCGCYPPNWQQTMENFLNAIPPNKYVLAYTVGEIWHPAGMPDYAQISSYSNSLYSAFESFGAVSIRNTTDSVPYILFGKKGMSAGQGHEVKGVNKSSIITLVDSIKTKWTNGYIASEKIGPSYKWNSLHWRVKSEDTSPGDTTILKVVGYKPNGVADTLAVFPEDSMDVIDLGNYTDAATHPYLKLIAFMKDYAHGTSPQLKRWQVLYDEAPECALNPLKGFQSINDTLQEGDEVTFTFPIENVGIKNFTDSLVVTYWIEDNNRNKTPLPQKMKSKPFVPGQVFIDTVKVNSYQFVGANGLWIYVNPYGNSKYQAEQYQFNNIGRYGFRVSRDVTNPLLDVTFDGIRILNGDIVSAKPNILVTLKDENKFLALNDTSAFTVYLQSPNSSTQQRIYFGQGLQFTPASLPHNSCSIYYNPTLPVDGKYKLIVQAKDRSNNRSGAQSYEIQFEVNNKPTITNLMNYPNPFTTSTRFVFTLTGSEIPEVFTIQIMTVSGKLVREIKREELGHLHIGRNITEYAWDARDEYGDRLGNGVYLYKVITKLNGENIEKSGTAADKYFVKEFGKMVIMR